MTPEYTEEKLENMDKETIIQLFLSQQNQLRNIDKNLQLVLKQLADSKRQRFGRSSEKHADYAKSERQFRVNGAAVPFPTAHQRRPLFTDFVTLAHAYSVHSFQDGKNVFCQ